MTIRFEKENGIGNACKDGFYGDHNTKNTNTEGMGLAP